MNDTIVRLGQAKRKFREEKEQCLKEIRDKLIDTFQKAVCEQGHDYVNLTFSMGEWMQLQQKLTYLVHNIID